MARRMMRQTTSLLPCGCGHLSLDVDVGKLAAFAPSPWLETTALSTWVVSMGTADRVIFLHMTIKAVCLGASAETMDH
ncbi:hypothetical protein E2562_031249 [Oryza meyeriana var. granulata]|uniref:Uncharacterized protein n=1 Tax=Oryza meyeriana var. granulata TaxID=110450 RepID=A0A6G1FEB3_9ORYZ|nr:hypothetical protein E2562_031249 [Oryza meyeriana var. granulata]